MASYGLCCDRCGKRGCCGGCGKLGGDVFTITPPTPYALGPTLRGKSPFGGFLGGLFGPTMKPQSGSYAPSQVPEWTYAQRYGPVRTNEQTPRVIGSGVGYAGIPMGTGLSMSLPAGTMSTARKLALALVATLVVMKLASGRRGGR